MEIFLDTANINEIKEISEMGIIQGVTTNPSLIAKEGRDVLETIKEIANLVDGPISGEVISEDSKEMISEAINISKVHKNIVVKIPMTQEGLKAVKVLTEKGIRTNVTLVFSAAQALLAAKSGATYVSPFVGRLDDISCKGLDLISEIAEMFSIHQIETKIISASIRNPNHMIESALRGADIATVPYKVIKQCLLHPLTDAGIKKFKADYERNHNYIKKQ